MAREYQLPGVVQIANATGTLNDGQRITVDGDQGIVWLENDDEPSKVVVSEGFGRHVERR